MNYRSVADLTALLQDNLYRFSNVDIVVGVPRSGMIPASILATLMNKRLSSLDEICSGRILSRGKSRLLDSDITDASVKAGDVILVVDDSIASGSAMAGAREKLESLSATNQIVFLAIYGSAFKSDAVDFVLEKVSHPRLFEWNMMHHPLLSEACVDIDGVLCRDPTSKENDDAEHYRDFISNVLPRINVTRPIGHLVTNRLEKYRAETQAWLDKCNIEYKELHMLNVSNARERRERGDYHSHKVRVYLETGSAVFIESDPRQAELIANFSGKSVVCIETAKIYRPAVGLKSLVQGSKSFWRNLRGRLRAVARIIARKF